MTKEEQQIRDQFNQNMETGAYLRGAAYRWGDAEIAALLQSLAAERRMNQLLMHDEEHTHTLLEQVRTELEAERHARAALEQVPSYEIRVSNEYGSLESTLLPWNDKRSWGERVVKWADVRALLHGAGEGTKL